MSQVERKHYDKYFEEVLNQHHAAISRVVSTYEMHRALQEELYQEISVALWKALARFDSQSSLKTYILSIAHKRAVSHVAKHVKEPYTAEISEYEISGGDCPSENMGKTQRMEKLLKAIRCLPMLDRQLVTLALEGVSYKDISSILGITVSNVGVKLNRAKSKLNQFLSGEASA